MTYLLVTNNDEIQSDYDIHWVDGSFEDVIKETHKLMEEGHELLVSPLPASIRMFYSPVRTMVLTKEKKGPSKSTLQLIEDALGQYKAVLVNKDPDYRNLEDYKYMDKKLFNHAMAELSGFNN